jgi:hypothetical protein
MAEENRTNSKKLKTQQRDKTQHRSICGLTVQTHCTVNIPPLLLPPPVHVLARLSWYTCSFNMGFHLVSARLIISPQALLDTRPDFTPPLPSHPSIHPIERR